MNKLLLVLIMSLAYIGCIDDIKTKIADVTLPIVEQEEEEIVQAKQLTNQFITRINEIMKDVSQATPPQQICKKATGNTGTKYQNFTEFTNKQWTVDNELTKLAIANVQKTEQAYQKAEAENKKATPPDPKHDLTNFVFPKVKELAAEDYTENNKIGMWSLLIYSKMGTDNFKKELDRMICYALERGTKTGESQIPESGTKVKGSDATKAGAAQFSNVKKGDIVVYFSK